MKKVLSFILAFAIIQSLCISVFATDLYSVNASNGEQRTVEGNVSPGGVTATGEGTTVDVKGSVTNTNGDGVKAAEGAKVVVYNGVDGSSNGVTAIDDAYVAVSGSVKGENGIEASFATVNVEGSVKGGTDGVHAINSAEVMVIDGSVTGGTNGIHAVAAKEVTVEGPVTGGVDGDGIVASDSKVNVAGTVKGGTHGVSACNGAEVKVVEGSVEGDMYGIEADKARVDIEGSVTGGTIGIEVSNSAEVNVEGSVTGGNYAVVASGGKVTINGDVSGSQLANKGSNVTVSGDADGGVTTIDTSTVVIVEGLVTGDISAGNASSVYLGELKGDIKSGNANVFYLLGLAKDSVGLQNVKIVTNTVAPDMNEINGSNNVYYATVGADIIAGKEISVRASSDKKVVKIDAGKLPVGVKLTTENGVTKLTFDANFRGGLQDLLLTLDDFVNKDPEKPVNKDPEKPVIIVFSEKEPEFVPIVIAVDAAEGVAEAYTVNHCVGVKFAADFVSGVQGLTGVRVTNETTEEELAPSQFTVYVHKDGSADLLFSNTYLKTLEAGEYVFRITVGGETVSLTVSVPEV